jgi:CTD small phosphatase-like protein 2
MKPSQKSLKKTLPTLKRSSTPCITKRKLLLSKSKAVKSKKVNTEPLPSPNSSFNDDCKKASVRSTQRNFSPFSQVKLNFYLKLERRLWAMVQAVNEPSSFQKSREEFWELVKKNKVWEIEECFKDLKNRKAVRKALIVEMCGVMLATDLYRANDAVNNLKNLSLFIHQNYIEVLFAVNSTVKLPVNPSSKQLKTIIQTRRMTTIADKHISLSQNTEILSGLLKDICKHFRQYSKQSALSSSIFSILKSLNKVTYSTVREVISQALTLSEPILIPPEEPFLPSVSSETFTLVLDLDETLVHFVQNKDEGAVYIRPGCDEFLKDVSQWFEVVVFTAGLQDVIHKQVCGLGVRPT